MNATLPDRIRSGEPTVGTFLNLGSPLAAEACALAGFDWLLADLEHGAGGEAALVGQITAAAAHDVEVLVRVESDERIRCGRVLDLGAAGVMFPRLDSADQAADAIGHLRYPPAGDRGVATYNRACGFGVHAEALDTANERVLGIVQIETVTALDDAEAIADTPGVDVVFVGPADLSYALGVPRQLDAPEFQGALDRVLAAARNAGTAAGILAPNREVALRYHERGFTFLAVGSDSAFLVTAGREAAGRLPTAEGHWGAATVTQAAHD
jgi:4-hydroxy-2-oxoheptanedioate aldolase